MSKKESKTEYMQRMNKLEESTRVYITEHDSIRRSFYDDGGKEVNVIEIGSFDRFEIMLHKPEAEKLVQELQKLIKQL